MTRGYYARRQSGYAVLGAEQTPEGQQAELDRVNSDVARFSAELTRAVNDKGYITHDPMHGASVETTIQDGLARAAHDAEIVSHGGKLVQDPLVEFFKSTWAPAFVLDWLTFYRANTKWLAEQPDASHYAHLERWTSDYADQLKRHHATVAAFGHKVTPPRAPSAPTAGPPPLTAAEREAIRARQGAPAPPAPTPDKWDMAKIALYGALVLGGVIALSSMITKGR